MLICYIVFTISINSCIRQVDFRWHRYQLNHKELSIAATAAFSRSRAGAAVGNSA
jgi:hypothetical protein